MKKRITVYGLITLLILFGAIIVIFDDPTITSASITSAAVGIDASYTACITPSEASAYLNEKGCTKIYEDPICQAEGNVEVRCPSTESPEEEEEEKEVKPKRGWRKRAKRHRPFYNFYQFLRWFWYRAGGKDF